MTFDVLEQFTREDRLPSGGVLFSLKDVGERGVSLHWDEAVAIVEELCETAIAAAGDTAPVPDPEDVLLGSDGRITLRRTRGDKSPTAAGRMLHTLLSNDSAPMPLRLFVTQSTAHDTHQSLREFARGLAYFGKPGRERLIQDVHARCAQAERRPADAAPAPPPLPKHDSDPAKDADRQRESKRKLRKRLVYVASALTFVGSAAWLWSSGRSAHDVRGSASRALSDAAHVLADLRQQVRDTLSPTAAAPVVPAAESSVDSGRAPRRRGGSSPSAVASRPDPPPLASRPVSMRKSGGPLQLAMTVPSAVTSGSPVVDHTSTELAPPPAPMYSSADTNVQPPVLLSPQLIAPIGPAATRSILNRMVVVVSAEGTVERVQLVEGPARMPDMMMLSGVKTWRFTPASKDGEPVRYRTVISWPALP